MVVTREMMVKRLAEKSGFYQQDIRHVLHCMDEAVDEYMNDYTDDEEVAIQLVEGLKLCCKVTEPQNKYDLKTGQISMCEPMVKVYARVSDTLKKNMRQRYRERNDG